MYIGTRTYIVISVSGITNKKKFSSNHSTEKHRQQLYNYETIYQQLQSSSRLAVDLKK